MLWPAAVCSFSGNIFGLLQLYGVKGTPQNETSIAVAGKSPH
jgi:hypothetical protein